MRWGTSPVNYQKSKEAWELLTVGDCDCYKDKVFVEVTDDDVILQYSTPPGWQCLNCYAHHVTCSKCSCRGKK